VLDRGADSIFAGHPAAHLLRAGGYLRIEQRPQAGGQVLRIELGERKATVVAAAGALLVMLIDSMIPSDEESGRVAGLVPTLGFAVATRCRAFPDATPRC
jgi:hypothetical protein